MATITKTAIVVGGSLTGLMAAIMLRSHGYSVRVLERSSPETLQSQAAAVRCGPQVQSFLETYVKDLDPKHVLVPESSEIMAANGEVTMVVPALHPMRLTSWKRVYDMLKIELLREIDGLPVAVYETSRQVEDVKDVGAKMVVAYWDLETENVQMREANLVIAADGAYSAVRKIVMDEIVHPTYAGCVSWRGRVPEEAVNCETRAALQERVVVLRVEGGYMVSYNVPSDPGSASPSGRDFVWVWYDSITEDSQTFIQAFTDVDGKKHDPIVPSGKMRWKVWEEVLQRVDSIGNPHFTDLGRQIDDPIISAVCDLPATKSVFCDEKVLLLGEAFALCRPYAGGSTSQAAFQVLELRKVLDRQMRLDEWERNCIIGAKIEQNKSLVAAHWFCHGVMPEFMRRAMEKAQARRESHTTEGART